MAENAKCNNSFLTACYKVCQVKNELLPYASWTIICIYLPKSGLPTEPICWSCSRSLTVPTELGVGKGAGAWGRAVPELVIIPENLKKIVFSIPSFYNSPRFGIYV